MKFCPGCKTQKPFAEFSQNKRRHDGLTNYCRVCWRGISRQQYEKNRDKLAAKYREDRANGVIKKRSPRRNKARKPAVPRATEKLSCGACGLQFRRRVESFFVECVPCRKAQPVAHGTCTTYGRGCRCRPCTDAASENAVRNRRKRLAASGLPDDNRHRTRARRFGGSYEVVNKVSVFERDNWVCGLCKEPVDPALKWPDPFSVSLDHVVPLFLGGDHTYANTQCSHLRCNQSRARRAA